MVFSLTVRAWFYLVPNVLSIFCSIFVLYHLLFDRNLRHALHNHAIIILLLTNLLFELTDVSWMVHYYFFRYTIIQNPTFILIWIFIDYFSYYLQALLFAWATIERHILVFHDRWLQTRKQRFFLHYLPISTLVMYCFTYYFILFFFPFCENTFDYSKLFGLASIHCIYMNPFIPEWDLMFNQIVPAFIIVIFSMTLLIRVLWQKHRLLQSINWRKQRRMIYQLLSITLIYLIFNIPCSLFYLAYHIGFFTAVDPDISFYLVFFAYYLAFLFPFVCAGTLPNLTDKIQRFCFCQPRRRIIHPTG